MNSHPRIGMRRVTQILSPILGAGLLFLLALFTLRHSVHQSYADPIPPPEGYPKLSLSLKTVTPTLAGTGGATLTYTVEIRNTGAYTATDVTLSDTIPAGTTLIPASLTASSGAAPVENGGVLSWMGDVGFDDVTTVDFAVLVDAGYSGSVRNTAVISQAEIAEPVAVTAETVVTDEPLFAVGKSAQPAKPGAGKALTYTLVVTNLGQPAVNVPLTVTDQVPADTTLGSTGPDGSATDGGAAVTWHRAVTLAPGETTLFTFTVDVSDVASGTVIANNDYSVDSAETAVAAGEPYTVTVIDPIFTLFKDVTPDPPGANREMTYTLTLFNEGSQATDLVITDRVPAGVTYERGGTHDGSMVTWEWPLLDTDETAEFTYTVSISDVANYYVTNDDYGVCSGEGVCAPGIPITSFVRPATFDVSIDLNPLAKAPGGGPKDEGGKLVTPTIVLENEGPGTALDASALLRFHRISVQEGDLLIEPDSGSGTITPGSDCGDKCVEYYWQGDLVYGEAITITTIDGQSTIGGEEGVVYTATVVVTDTLANSATEPLTATQEGYITHYSNLLPNKLAPKVIGRGQLMTYTINVWNSGLSTDTPPYPILVDTVPPSTTVVSVSDSGITQVVSSTTVVSWTLPSMSPGDLVRRSYVVQVDDDLISGTQVINDEYYARWYSAYAKDYISNTGKPVTTTVVEAGLVDSFKVVTPTLASPGSDNTFTYTVHVVNSGPVTLTDVSLYDYLPWENSTYQRDAVASAGSIISDIVSLEWSGSVGAFSEERITLTVKADPGFEGTLTNTAVISHEDLLHPVTVTAVAYVTDDPVLQISKRATPDPVPAGSILHYTIRVQNQGQQATALVITDTLPTGASYLADSATAGGSVSGGVVHWSTPVLDAGETRTYGFDVVAGTGREVRNEFYGVRSAEGVSARGAPVITRVTGGTPTVHLPVVMR